MPPSTDPTCCVSAARRRGENVGFFEFWKHERDALPRGNRYTPTTGIWQTVWLERVDSPSVYVDRLDIATNATAVTVGVNVGGASDGAGPGVDVVVSVLDRAGGGVLVHCMQGRSRSVALVAAHLVAEGSTLDAAAARVVAARAVASPNAGFVRRLRAFEAHCRAGRDPAEFGRAPPPPPPR